MLVFLCCYLSVSRPKTQGGTFEGIKSPEKMQSHSVSKECRPIIISKVHDPSTNTPFFLFFVFFPPKYETPRSKQSLARYSPRSLTAPRSKVSPPNGQARTTIFFILFRVLRSEIRLPLTGHVSRQHGIERHARVVLKSSRCLHTAPTRVRLRALWERFRTAWDSLGREVFSVDLSWLGKNFWW